MITTRSIQLVFLLSFIACLGVPLKSSATQSIKPDKNGFVEAHVTSNPPGAKVTYTAFGKSRVIGQTPFSWSFLLSDITRSSMIPTLTFELVGHETQSMPLSSEKKVHAKLKAKKAR